MCNIFAFWRTLEGDSELPRVSLWPRCSDQARSNTSGICYSSFPLKLRQIRSQRPGRCDSVLTVGLLRSQCLSQHKGNALSPERQDLARLRFPVSNVGRSLISLGSLPTSACSASNPFHTPQPLLAPYLSASLPLSMLSLCLCSFYPVLLQQLVKFSTLQ